MDDIKEFLKQFMRTENELTVPVSGTGSAGMETCFVNLIEPDDTVISIGSGSGYAVAAARAYLEAGEKDPSVIVKKALQITADICIYTNDNITILKA